MARPRRGYPEEEDGYSGDGDELEYGSPRLIMYRLQQVEKQQRDLADKFDSLIKTLVGSVLTIAILLTVYVLTTGGPGS